MKRLLGICTLSLCFQASLAMAAGGPVKIGVAAMISPKETFKYYRRLIHYVSAKLGQPIEMVQNDNYAETDRLLERGELSFAFICSGPYVKDHERFGVQLLAAPVVHGQPFYQAYILVHKDSPINDLAALKGKSFAFTDPKSHTGKVVPTYMVAKRFKTTPDQFFSIVKYTKNHDRSIEAVAKKWVDGASIDGLIYDYLAQRNSPLVSQVKIIKKSEQFGIPPIVVPNSTDPALREKVREILLTMHKDMEGREILDGIMIDKFIVPKDSDYDSVREMEHWLKKNR